MAIPDKRVQYTESLGILPDSEMLGLMLRYRLTPEEKTMGFWLSALMAIQILSTFAIVPVFITFASLLTGGENYLKIALVLSGYAITQMLFQPIMTQLSRKIGYRVVILFGSVLFFVASALLAYAIWKNNLKMIIMFRLLQGFGALMTPILSLAIESCRPQARGAMLITIATGIGLGFSAAMPIGATLDRLSYIFIGHRAMATATIVQAPYFIAIGLGILGLVSAFIIMLKVRVMDKNKGVGKYYLNIQEYMYVLLDPRMLAIYVGAFILPMIFMMLFYHIPFALRDIGGIAHTKVWFVYLFTFIFALLSVLPFILVSTSPKIVKIMLIASVSMLLLSLLLLVFMPFGLLGMVSGLTFLFVAFNLSEMIMVRIVPRIIEPEIQPAGLLVFLFVQLLGTVFGSWLGAVIMAVKGWGWIYLVSVLLSGIWLSVLLLIEYDKTDYTLPLELQHQDTL
jgi:MFS family permease